MLDMRFVTLEQIGRLVDELPLEQKEKLLADKIRDLPVKSKLQIIGLSDTGLAVVTGSLVSLNSDVTINIQNCGGNTGLDPETLFRALAEFKKSGGEKR